jgi:hypothetical protein
MQLRACLRREAIEVPQCVMCEEYPSFEVAKAWSLPHSTHPVPVDAGEPLNHEFQAVRADAGSAHHRGSLPRRSADVGVRRPAFRSLDRIATLHRGPADRSRPA